MQSSVPKEADADLVVAAGMQSSPSLGSSGDVASSPTAVTSATKRQKHYKCGVCQELGHNSKTCPRRPGQPVTTPPPANHPQASPTAPAAHATPTKAASTPASRSAVAIAPAPVPEVSSPGPVPVATAAPVLSAGSAAAQLAYLPPGPARPEEQRLGALPLEKAIAMARNRVIQAEMLVTSSTNAAEYDLAMMQLDASVASLERAVLCAQRVAQAVKCYNGV